MRSTPYRIGFDVPFEPLGTLMGGRASGLLVELVRATLERAGAPHVFVSMTLAETEGALLSGTVDALAYKGITPERRNRMIFSAPLLMSGAAIFTRSGTPPGADLARFAGSKVVTPRKGPLWAQIERTHPDLQLVDGDSYEGSFGMLLAGRADLAALNLHAGIAIANRLHPGRIALPSAPYAPLPIGLAIALDGPRELVETIDATLPSVRADGTYQRLHDHWI